MASIFSPIKTTWKTLATGTVHGNSCNRYCTNSCVTYDRYYLPVNKLAWSKHLPWSAKVVQTISLVLTVSCKKKEYGYLNLKSISTNMSFLIEQVYNQCNSPNASVNSNGNFFYFFIIDRFEQSIHYISYWKPIIWRPCKTHGLLY